MYSKITKLSCYGLDYHKYVLLSNFQKLGSHTQDILTCTQLLAAINSENIDRCYMNRILYACRHSPNTLTFKLIVEQVPRLDILLNFEHKELIKYYFERANIFSDINQCHNIILDVKTLNAKITRATKAENLECIKYIFANEGTNYLDSFYLNGNFFETLEDAIRLAVELDDLEAISTLPKHISDVSKLDVGLKYAYYTGRLTIALLLLEKGAVFKTDYLIRPSALTPYHEYYNHLQQLYNTGSLNKTQHYIALSMLNINYCNGPVIMGNC